MEKLHEMDDAFRKQLESMLAAHQEELLQLENEKEKQVEAANEKVILILNLYVYCICIYLTAAATVVLGSQLLVSIWLISGWKQPWFSTRSLQSKKKISRTVPSSGSVFKHSEVASCVAVTSQ